MANFNVARVYADVNQSMPRSYWDYDSVNISESGLSPSPGPAPMRPARFRCRCWPTHAADDSDPAY